MIIVFLHVVLSGGVDGRSTGIEVGHNVKLTVTTSRRGSLLINGVKEAIKLFLRMVRLVYEA